MNLRKLKEAEAAFLDRFPEGFADPGLEQMRRRHKVGRLAEFASESLTPMVFSQPRKFADVLLKIVSRSSMVSRFEKPPFRAFLAAQSSKDLRRLADSFKKRLIGRRKHEGFDEIVDQLAPYKQARWPLVSAVPFYFAPTKEAFVKPSTAKRIVAFLEVDALHYRPRPDWAFYDGYRKLILDIRDEVDPSLTSSNAAITGFLMSTM